MSELFQPGQHPDADQLNAFVEHVLPRHEREQTLAHLAVCSDCRAVVALSLPLDEPAPGVAPEPVRRPWFFGWNFLWPAAAALAVAGFLMIYIHNAAISRRNTPVSEIAASHLPTRLPAPSAPLAPAIKPSEPSVGKSKVPSQKNEKVTGAAAASKSETDGAVTLHQSIDSIPLQGRNFRAMTPRPPESMGGLVKTPPSRAIAGAAASSPVGVASDTEVGAAAIRAQPQAAPSPPRPPASDTVTVSADRASISSDDALLGATIDSQEIASLETTGLAKQTILPSRLPALSRVANAHRVLAIDSHNTLFLSTDDGKHWSSVSAQWNGKAVRVELASYAAPAGRSSAFMATGSPSTAPLSTATSAVAVANSVLTGTVKDSTGAVIPDASIELRKAGMTPTRTVRTDRSGRYLAGGLVPGRYEVEARAPGFEKQIVDVTLTASQQSVSNLTLKVGQATEAVEVQAATVPLADSPVTVTGIIGPAPARVPPAVFEITTDNGDRWTSSDGKIWKRK